MANKEIKVLYSIGFDNAIYNCIILINGGHLRKAAEKAILADLILRGCKCTICYRNPPIKVILGPTIYGPEIKTSKCVALCSSACNKRLIQLTINKAINDGTDSNKIVFVHNTGCISIVDMNVSNNEVPMRAIDLSANLIDQIITNTLPKLIKKIEPRTPQFDCEKCGNPINNMVITTTLLGRRCENYIIVEFHTYCCDEHRM